MNLARSNMVAAAVGAAAALVATGITYASAAADPAPAAAPTAAAGAPRDGGTQSKGNEEGKGNEGRGEEGREREGRIQINERSYSSHPGDCITVVSGLGAKTLNIRNDSDKTVEVFRGAVCDNGGPIATVGRHSDSFGVRACPPEGIEVEDGVIASFRVKHKDHDD
ncbi:hypothetical protein [Streptomyces roseochromogenus]|uniref:Secreted protein n=1 Tax=Streptomyces roseochromogenus subsp. oscitans DS 12.976 TaxID=1352936 RepID=V6JX30_STRRC|nr:hypothetical protein [Streptomyces roseochromogenus]EST23696.1 hypothetical protein M878_32830 [Streptomyces roseochromogenus subsp. oscitans DS 12.976]